MSEKNTKTKKEPNKKTTPEIELLIDKKMLFFYDVIQKTILHVQQNKMLDIIKLSDVNNCINTLFELNKKIKSINELNIKTNTDEVINVLQTVNNELSVLFKLVGTHSFEDLLWICFGNNSVNAYAISDMDKQKFELLKKYFHPTSYKLMSLKGSDGEKSAKFDDSDFNEKSKNLDGSDVGIKIKQFHLKVYGIQIIVHNPQHKKSLIITGTVDDIIIDFLNNKFVNLKYQAIKENMPQSHEFQGDTFNRFIESLNLKDYLISEPHEIYSKYAGCLSNLNTSRQKTITQVVKEFIGSDLFMKRNIIIQLLVKIDKYDNQYLAYLLYDLLSNDVNGAIDTQEQTILFDSFPWSIKQYFKDAMKNMVQYTNDLSNFDIQKIPLEQQICLLKVSDSVKEKAMQKLKEIKAKSEDSGSKARQYLDGLLKIPFNVYKKEPILNIMNTIKLKYINMLQTNNITNATIKDNYTSLEILTTLKSAKNNTLNKIDSLTLITEKLEKMSCNELKILVTKINEFIIKNKLDFKRFKMTNRNMKERQNDILEFIQLTTNKDLSLFNNELINDFFKLNIEKESLSNNDNETKEIESKYCEINTYMTDVKSTLDKAVHGHDSAKKQIERIIGQWINGKQDGYCFGFEGPAGVGKCFAKNTPIMLSNGYIKMVQDITINDKLMGDDSKPRNVLALGNGIEKMYKITQCEGDDYIVNESHILSLKMTTTLKTILGKKYYKNDIVDICIKDYIGLSKYLKSCLKGYKVNVDFPEKNVDIEPYTLGKWLMSDIDDATIDDATIDDATIGAQTIDNLSKYNLINNRHIPQEYKCNSRETRLKLLAGIIDSKENHNKLNNDLEIIETNRQLAEDILWLVRSVGFRGSIKQTTINGTNKCEHNFRIIITTKVIKNNLNTKIRVIPLNVDEYFGFQIDGNSRFLLGDFTVTHNTTLAKKGLADCLKDENGVPRPFSMIQMGGDANGSSLHGHNYTYVGSTWGSIVQILIDKKCMNPIIFIDEIDKISKTEHGKEIVGILTHLLDPAQNDCFQDKYFSGIDLDLSKALFILSYNDVDAIDKIMLDRIHRVKFKSLTLDEKMVISNTHILPEVYDKMGLQGMITLSNDVLKFIIDEYTLEPGVRKLKEILFEIVGEINLDILKNFDTKYEIPINITIEDIKTKHFKDKQEIKHKKIHTQNKIGIINGLWANAQGKGGVIPIQASWRPSEKFLHLHLTGMQGDVMKESMNVALTLAWNLTSSFVQDKLFNKNDNNLNGVHIHCPEGSTPKDGPSAGTAITTTIFSLLNNKKIKYNIAITGEITLDGNVTEIGGLDLKFLGGIKAGVTEFIYPKENQKDYDSFMEKYKDDELTNGIKFHCVETIDEVFGLVFE
jgi:ATP-dependent Lon protease